MSNTSSILVKWTRLTPKPDPKHGIPLARSSHGVSLVQNASRLILYGGEHVARTPIPQDAWAIDNLMTSDCQSWRRLNFDDGPPDRIAHAQAVYQDKYVYIFGGRAGITMEEKAMNDLWMLDCSGLAGTETWKQVFPNLEKGDAPPEPRSFHRMICIGSNLYVFGGCGSKHGRLADFHRFDLERQTWHELEPSSLRGRGGPNLLSLRSGTCVGVVAGFAGEETADGQLYDIATGKWNNVLTSQLQGMRPRSVCVAESFPLLKCAIIFGGEVDPSDRGHEGAGGFENDIVVLDESSGALRQTIKAAAVEWPEQRGWSASAARDGQLFLYGGLSGDDANPQRLDDLWRLELSC